MSIRNLEALFAPRSVALIGASTKPNSVGDVVARNLLTAGFPGPVMTVNPKGGAIRSTLAYPSVDDLPMTPDLAVICTPPDTVPGLIDALGRRGTRGAVVITAGFGELGQEGLALQQQFLDAARPHLLRIVGPNCVGMCVPGAGLNASFVHRHPLKGGLAFLAQSGAVITSVVDWASSNGIGFSHIVSLGGMADVDFGDMLDYLAADPGVTGILLYVESITQARKFMSAARAASRVKPVIVIKAGRFEEGARAAASHTGALAGSDSVYHAAFRRAGMLRVLSFEELFEAVETLAMGTAVDGDRLAILTNGGGMGVLATDALIELGGKLATLAPETITKLNGVLPRTWSHGNPVDIIGDAPGSRYAGALEAIIADHAVDAVVVLNCPVAIADSVEAAEAVIARAKAQPAGSRKVPVFTSWVGQEAQAAARATLQAARIPTYETPEGAVRAFMHLVRYGRNQDLLLETPAAVELPSADSRVEGQRIVAKALRSGRSMLTEPESKALLAAYGIPVVPTATAATPQEAAQAAATLGFPAVIKILSHDISHKTDVGGVALNLRDEAAVQRAAEAMLDRVARHMPRARIDGFTVQPMAARPGAHELICGLIEDSVFGPVVLFGQGGTSVEVVRDKAVALLPLNMTLAQDLVRRTRVAKLLAGYRDRPAADIDAVARTLMALGQMAVDIPELAELDINPLWADASGVLALDARVKLSAGAKPGTERFAIRPYPSELEARVEDQRGRSYFLRPVRPEDAPLLQAMILRCDPEDIRMRFFSALKRLPDKLAARLTQIDYDREMAFVAMTSASDEDPAVGGVVRLSADPDGQRAEYSVIVRSDLKGTGLGWQLMQVMLRYAKARGIGTVFGEVLRENRAMLDMAAELGFTRHERADDPGIVEVTIHP